MVVFGGRSEEHKVSIDSARAVADALHPRALRLPPSRVSSEEHHEARGAGLGEAARRPRQRRRRLPRSAWSLWRGRHYPGRTRDLRCTLRGLWDVGERRRYGQGDDEEDLRLSWSTA